MKGRKDVSFLVLASGQPIVMAQKSGRCGLRALMSNMALSYPALIMSSNPPDASVTDSSSAGSDAMLERLGLEHPRLAEQVALGKIPAGAALLVTGLRGPTRHRTAPKSRPQDARPVD